MAHEIRQFVCKPAVMLIPGAVVVVTRRLGQLYRADALARAVIMSLEHGQAIFGLAAGGLQQLSLRDFNLPGGG